MIVKLGGSMRYDNLGPSTPGLRQGISGVHVGEMVPSGAGKLRGLGNGPTGEYRPFQPGDSEAARRERQRKASEAYRLRKGATR